MQWSCLARVIGGLSLATVAVGAVQARPLVPAEKRYVPYTGNLPTCDDPSVLGRIQTRFQQKESEYWNSALEIASIDQIGEAGYRTIGADYIPRRYCTGRALLNDGRLHQITYWIGENLGIIGYDFGVEWCVAGLDRNWAYAPNCRAARP